MPRAPRHAPGGLVYHVLNWANARAAIFADSDDYAAFERILREALQRLPLGQCKDVLWFRKSISVILSYVVASGLEQVVHRELGGS